MTMPARCCSWRSMVRLRSRLSPMSLTISIALVDSLVVSVRGRTLFLPVMITTGPYAEDQESRRMWSRRRDRRQQQRDVAREMAQALIAYGQQYNDPYSTHDWTNLHLSRAAGPNDLMSAARFINYI